MYVVVSVHISGATAAPSRAGSDDKAMRASQASRLDFLTMIVTFALAYTGRLDGRSL